MAAQIHTLLPITTSFTNKSIPQLLLKSSRHTTSVRGHRRHTCSSKPSKTFKSLYKLNSKPLLECVPQNTIIKHANLVEAVAELISSDRSHVNFHDLLLVDAFERQGLDYYFEDEINIILEECYRQFDNKDFISHQNLYEVSLCFRLLRQKGYRVTADVFESFKGKNGKFVENIEKDIGGLMELYEASQLRIEGENILDEAAIFGSYMLQRSLIFLDDKEAKIVRYTLENPHRTRFNLVNSIEGIDAPILKELVELDSNMVQSIRKMEVNEILRWWKGLGVEKDLHLARNQPIKWYIVSMVSLANPMFSQERIDLTKAVALIYIMDDIFDRYGTLDELTLLTEAVSTWDIRFIAHLPYYMKTSFKALYDITNEIANRVYEKHGFNPINALQKSWATLCTAFLVEAKWFASRQVPKSEEYLNNGMVSSGVQVFLVHMFFLLEDGATIESANIIDNNQGIVSSVSKILRLSDDLEYEQVENQDDHDGSYVKCFLMEHKDSTIKSAREYVKDRISDAWKCLNNECLSPNPFSEKFLKGSINLARLVPLMYHCGQDNSFDQIEEYIKSIM